MVALVAIAGRGALLEEDDVGQARARAAILALIVAEDVLVAVVLVVVVVLAACVVVCEPSCLRQFERLKITSNFESLKA